MRNKLLSVEFQRAFPTNTEPISSISVYCVDYDCVISGYVAGSGWEALQEEKKAFVTERLVVNSNNFCQMSRPAKRTSANLTADPRRTER
jgi:phosphoribosylaminoimidazole-succinocarboxamide synthase